MAVSVETVSKDKSARAFRLRDMLVPGPLLDRTNWRDNPLVVYSERRSRRPARWVALRVFEILVTLGLATIVVVPFQDCIGSIPLAGPKWKIVVNLIPLIACVLPFLILRYHLFVNDQSHHIKTLSRERLGELLLTRLGDEEYFLHHFLMFCRSYRVLVMWAALWGLMLAQNILSGSTRWVEYDSYSADHNPYAFLLGSLSGVLLTWIAGVYQYVTEWRWHAGGKAKGWQSVLSLGFSVVLSIPIVIISATIVSQSSVWVTQFALIIVSCAIAVTVTYFKGVRVMEMATEWLAYRYHGEEISPSPVFTRFIDPFAPLRWVSPFRAREFEPRKQNLTLNIVNIIIFTGTVLALRTLLYRLNLSSGGAVQAIVFCVIGMWWGLCVPLRDAAEKRTEYLRAMWWIGVGSLIAAVSLGIYDSYPNLPVSLRMDTNLDNICLRAIEYYLQCVNIGIVAFAAGVLAAGRGGKLYQRALKIGLFAFLVILMCALVLSHYWVLAAYEYLVAYFVMRPLVTWGCGEQEGTKRT